jgi:hypothetical protein
VVPWRYNVAAFNGCQDGRVVVFTTVDANGTVTTTYGVDGVTLDIPSLPFNLTINFEDSPDDVTSVSLFATDSHTYKVGTGPPREFLFALTHR